MLAVRLPENTEDQLANLANQTGRSKSYYIRQAIEEYLAEHEDYLIAIARLEKRNPRLSLEEMERRLGLED